MTPENIRNKEKQSSTISSNLFKQHHALLFMLCGLIVFKVVVKNELSVTALGSGDFSGESGETKIEVGIPTCLGD